MKGTNSVSAFAVYKNMKQKGGGKVSYKKKDRKNKNNKRKLQEKIKIAVTNKSDFKQVQTNLNKNGINSKTTKNAKQVVEKSISNAKSKRQKNKPKPVDSKKPLEKKLQKLRKPTYSLENADEEPPELVEAMFDFLEEDSERSETQSFPKPDKLFKWFVSPLEVDTFFMQYWEKTPLHIDRPESDYYKHMLTTKQIDTMLRENSLFYTRNIDIVSYENGKRETHNPDGKAVPSAVWDFYDNGCSIRILNPHTYNEKVHLLLATLQEYFGTMVGANVYLTPPGSQGFAPHWDDIEAFVIQLEGRKHWKLYAPKSERNELARYSSHNLSTSELGELTHSITLNEGGILYFPRGTIHEACTDSESHSLHLTVSVYQNTSYADLLERVLPEALKRATEEDIQFRRGLPLQYLTYTGVGVSSNVESKQKLISTVKNLITKMIDRVDVDAAADQLGRKFMYDSLPPVPTDEEKKVSVRGDGEYLANGKIHNRVEFDPGTKVRLLRQFCLRLVIEGSMPKIYYNTENSRVYHGEEEQFLEIEMVLVPAVCHLISNFPDYVAIEELPIGDEALKIQVVSDLWERGLVVTKEKLRCVDDVEDDVMAVEEEEVSEADN